MFENNLDKNKADVSLRYRRVLIIEDSEAIRFRIRAVVEQFEQLQIVAEIDNGFEAIPAILVKEPDIVILDINLPGMSGIEILTALKNKMQEVLIIVLTNHPQSFYKQKCLAMGAKYFLDKAKQFHELSEVLKVASLDM